MDARICLKELGVPASLYGYQHLWVGIEMIWKDPSLMHQITKKLYPMIAKECDSTPARVERSIRHAIESCFDRGDPDVFEKYFGSSVNPARGKATNKEFMACIVDYMDMEESK